MNQPGAQRKLMPSSLLSEAERKKRDLNFTHAVYMESKNCLIVEYQSRLSKMAFTSKWTYPGMRGL